MGSIGNNFGPQYSPQGLPPDAIGGAFSAQPDQPQLTDAQILQQFKTQGLPQYLPTPSPYSGLSQLTYTPYGAPDVTNLSSREIGILFDKQLGAYDAFNALSPQDKLAKLVEGRRQTPKGSIDIGQVMVQPYVDAVVKSDYYQQLKARLKNVPGLTSKKLYQWALQPNLPPYMKIALKARGDARRMLTQTFQTNFQSIINKMSDDPATEEARKKAEEGDLKVLQGSFMQDDEE